jgi:hypothetical protein
MYVEAKFVTDIIPKPSSTDVALDSVISVMFGRDIDLTSINVNTFQIHKLSNGERVLGTVTYQSRTAVFAPSQPFEPGEKYRVILVARHGSSQMYIRDISEQPMTADYQSTFTTTSNVALEAPISMYPGYQAMISGSSVRFSFSTVDGADHYELALASSVEFSEETWHTAIYSTDDNTENSVISVIAAGPIEDGEYYWHVRAVSQAGIPGPWSELKQFVLENDESDMPVDIPADVPPVVAGTSPSSGEFNVLPTSIRIVLSAPVDVASVMPERFYVYKKNIQ